jgi:hypothetical protein
MNFDANQILMYQTEDGVTKIDVHMEDETVWLNQNQLAELFQRDRSVISKHIKNVFDENEVDEKSNVHFLHVANADRPVACSSELFENVGNISHEQIRIKAELEFEKYQEKNKDELSKVEEDFLESIKETQKLLEGKRGDGV